MHENILIFKLLLLFFSLDYKNVITTWHGFFPITLDLKIAYIAARLITVVQLFYTNFLWNIFYFLFILFSLVYSSAFNLAQCDYVEVQ